MNENYSQGNAVAAIRVSSTKQGLQGDSPQAQKEQIEQFAQRHNINIKKFFIFMESASGEDQPIQEAVDYCKSPKNDIQLFIIKSIDRFTRGGSYFYDYLKLQLTQHDVKLIDIYGIISNVNVNTLEHLGVEYKWSVYSPTKKSEILEAERAKDEIRDILSRMIGASIRYVRMGYRVRAAPYGYVNEKIDTNNGKRVVLKPHPKESILVQKMYELRAGNKMTDEEIVENINNLGYKSRIKLSRDRKDKTIVIGQSGGVKLSVKRYIEYIRKPLYAGVSTESWTKDAPVKFKFPGLVSVELFNQANRGKIYLTEENGEVKIYKNKPEDWRLKKLVKNPDYPYKRYVLCPVCRHPLYGSASKGHNGNHYPAYHCNKRNHYFRVPKEKFDETITNFVKNIKVTKEGVEKMKKAVLSKWQFKLNDGQQEADLIANKLKELENQKLMIGRQLPNLTSEVALKLLEDQLVDIDKEIKKLTKNQTKQIDENINMEIVLAVVGEFLENLSILLLGGSNPIKRAAYFGLLFEQTPTYQDLVSGTARLAPYFELIDRGNGINPQLWS